MHRMSAALCVFEAAPTLIEVWHKLLWCSDKGLRETTIFIKTYAKGTLFLITYVRTCGSSHLNCTPGAVCARARFFLRKLWSDSLWARALPPWVAGLFRNVFLLTLSCLCTSHPNRFRYRYFICDDWRKQSEIDPGVVVHICDALLYSVALCVLFFI